MCATIKCEYLCITLNNNRQPQRSGTEVQTLLLVGYAQGPLFCTVSERDAFETPKIAAAVAERSTCKLSSANPNS